MRDALKLRSDKVSQELFDRLPMLLSRYQFRFVTGLSDYQINELRKSGEIRAWKPDHAVYHKYYKSDAARLTGLKLG